MISDLKILVTGGAGFIGSNLVDRLLEQNNRVVCLDNFATGKWENLEGAMKHPAFTLVEGDVRNYEDCHQAVKGCDYVLHHAALESVRRSIVDPMSSTDVNIGGFVKMLYAAREAGVKRFVYAAGSSAYGDHPVLPRVEHQLGNALSPYGITKYVDELFAKSFSEVYGIETIGLRYFNVFGQRQDPDGAYAAVVPLFVKQLIGHQSPVINGDGSYSRDFIYIEDVIQANQLALITPTEIIRERQSKYFERFSHGQAGVASLKDGGGAVSAPVVTGSQPAALSEVFNVAFGESTSLTRLAQLLKDKLARFDPDIAEVKLRYGPARADDVPHSLAGIEKGQTILGYQPQYPVKKGLEEACRWYWQHFIKSNTGKMGKTH